MAKYATHILEIFEIAFISIGLVFIFRTFVAEPFMVGGLSMMPTFHDGDYLFVDRLSYEFRGPARGEVAVFHSPNGSDGYFLIKRVIGLPGERVKIEDGVVTIFNNEHPEGFVLEEEYLRGGTVTSGSADKTLGEEEYFVMGDNRSVSFDSRSWGALKRREIVGQARLRVWPPKSMMVFAAPEY